MKILKRTLTIIIAVITLTTTVYATEYPGLLRITEVQDNVVTGVDANKVAFRFVDVNEEWDVGDLCAVIFEDKGTEIIYDDEIKQTRYVGYIELFQ